VQSIRACVGVLFAVMLVLAVGVAASARADSVTDLGANLVPMGLNNADQVVGDVVNPISNADQAALWNGSLQMLGPLSPGDESDAYAISSGGRITGDDFAGTSSVHGAYWNGGGNAFQVGPFGGFDDNDDTVVTDADTAGDLVGFSPNSDSVNMGFFDHAGTPTTVGAAALGDQVGGTAVGAITPDGTEMLGDTSTTDTTYYLWSTADPSGSSGTELNITPVEDDALLDAGAEFGSGISGSLASDGTVLGYTGSGASKTYYIRLPSGTETKVTGLFRPSAVNASHSVVGYIFTPSNAEHAAIWQNGVVTDLNTLLPPGTSGWTLLEATAINDSGDIAGIALHNGQDVGFLMKTSATVSVKFGTIATLQFGKVVDVPVTVTAGSADLSSVSLGDGLAVSGDHAKVTEQASGIDGFALAANASKTFNFKLKGLSVGDAALSVRATGGSANGTVTDSATTTAKVWDPKVGAIRIKLPEQPGGSIDIEYRGQGWDPQGGPIKLRFSGEDAGQEAQAEVFQNTLRIRHWPKRTNDERTIRYGQGGGYCWGELSASQGGLYADAKIEGKWQGWVLWSANPLIKAREAFCEGEENSLLIGSHEPIVTFGEFSLDRLRLLGVRVFGVHGQGTETPVKNLNRGVILGYYDEARDVCITVSLDHNDDVITSALRGKCSS
jgi:hypothetical protein